MRRVKLREWSGRRPGDGRPEKKARRRPTPRWKIKDSIIYIRMRDEYLEREGILVKVGERRWRLRV